MGTRKHKFTPVTSVRPDSKGRVTLSKLAEGISSFRVSKDADGRLLLEPMVEIPARERWLYENPKALASVLRGIADVKAGRIGPLGSFSKYAKEEDDED